MESHLKKNYRIAVIGKKELSLGLRLTGISETYDVADGPEAEKVIRDIMQKDDIGLVVIGSRIVSSIKDRKILSLIDDSLMPVFIEVPSYKEEKAPDTLRRLIIRAIGIDINSKNMSG